MADFLGGLVSYAGNRIAQERSFAQQKELQKDAQNYNTLMWQKANDYNSAMQQMMRFQSAGLNPNLIYSQMSNGLAAPSIGAGSAPSPANMQPFDSLGVVSQLAQIDLLKEQAREHGNNADFVQTQKDAFERQLGQKDRELDIAQQNADTQKMLADSGVLVNDAQVEFLNEQKNKAHQEYENLITSGRILELDRKYLDETFETRKQELQVTIDKLKSEYNLNQKQAAFLQEQTIQLQKMFDKNMEKLNGEIREINSRADLNDQQKENLIRQKLSESNDQYWKDVAQYYRDQKQAARKAGYKGYETFWFNICEVGADIVYMAHHNLLIGGKKLF